MTTTIAIRCRQIMFLRREAGGRSGGQTDLGQLRSVLARLFGNLAQFTACRVVVEELGRRGVTHGM